MSGKAVNWQRGDGWVFVALSMYEDATNLVGLIAAADASNHAIINLAELKHGVGSLEAAGLASTSGGYSLTARGRELQSRLRGDLFSQVDHAVTLLGAYQIDESIYPLDEGTYHAAVEQYIAEAGRGS